MEDGCEYYPQNELPTQHIQLYGGRITDENLTRADFSIALENLIASELKINDDGVQTVLKNFEAFEEAAVGKSPNDAQLLTEFYATAPLVVLWEYIRALKIPKDAEVWLKKAVEVALENASDHEDCLDEEEDEGCEIRSFCPLKTVKEILLFDATADDDKEPLGIEDSQDAVERVRSQLRVAGKYALVTSNEFKALMQHYLEWRHSRGL